MKHALNLILVFVALVLLPLHSLYGEDRAGQDELSWGKYAARTYGKLNDRVGGDLAPAFRSLGGAGELYEYFDKDSNPKKFEAYQQFLVQALVDAKNGDVLEGMFANVLFISTPPSVVLAAIAPHIDEGGELEGILEGRSSDVAKHIQRQPQQGHTGRPNFIEYMSYLEGGQDRGLDSVNAAVIVDHMIKTDPQAAFISMLRAGYAKTNAKGNSDQQRKDHAQTLRDLRLAQIDIADYLARVGYSFPEREGQASAIDAHLRRLADHEQWWVRLYVARLMDKSSRLRDDELISKLRKDDNKHVKTAMEQLAEKLSQ